MDNFVSKLDSSSINKTFGDNGAPIVASLDDHLLEIFSKELTRGSKPHLKVSLDSSNEDIVNSVVLAFYARSILNGSGERLIFYQMFGDLLSVFPEVMLETLVLIPDPNQGGSWKDLNLLVEYLLKFHPRRETFILHANSVRSRVVEIYANQLQADILEMVEGSYRVSLAAKWVPSEKTHFWKILGPHIARRFFLLNHNSPASYSTMNSFYRKNVSFLRKTLDVVEVKMCGQQWSHIDFSHVPGVAMRQYGRYAFPNKILNSRGTEDRSRLEDRVTCAEHFQEYKRRGEAKFHGTTIGLHQYGAEFEKCLSIHNEDSVELLELQFGDLLQNLRKSVKTQEDFDVSKLIPLVDVSGSMSSLIAGKVSAMSIAIQLGLILSQLDLSSLFANRVITFSENPVWVNLKDCSTYLEKYEKIKNSQWSMNTDFEKAFNLILSVAVESKLSPEEMKGFKLIVFSDMQFDQASERPWNTLHKELSYKFEKEGYEVPGVIYWNLVARDTNGFTVDSSQTGTTMVSGFGIGQLKAMLSGDLHSTTPIEKMYEVLSNPVFDPLREVVEEELDRRIIV